MLIQRAANRIEVRPVLMSFADFGSPPA